jgi:hypothetical protein
MQVAQFGVFNRSTRKTNKDQVRRLEQQRGEEEMERALRALEEKLLEQERVQRQAEAEARRKAEAEVEPEARRQAEAEERLRAEAEVRRQAEAARRKHELAEAARRERELAEQRKAKAAAEVRRQAEAELRRQAEAELRRKAEAELRRKAAAEVRRLAEAARRERELAKQRQAEAELRRQAEAEVRRKAEAEARRPAEAEARSQAQAEERRKAEADARRQAEAEEQRQAEAEARRQAEAEEQRQAEAEARRQAEAEEQRQAEAEARRQAEAEEQRQTEVQRQAEAEVRRLAVEREVVIDTPERVETMTRTATIEGKILGYTPDMRVNLDGMRLAIQDGGAFAALVDLPSDQPKAYWLKVTVPDGTLFDKIITVVFRPDRIRPVIKTALSLEIEAATAVVSGFVTDNVGIDWVRLDGEPVELERNGRFETSLRVPEGKSRHVLAARDKSGNEVEVRIVILANLDRTGPVIEIQERVTSEKPDTMIRGRVSDRAGVRSVTVDGTEVAIAENGDFLHPMTLGYEGIRTISIIAIDKRGNRSFASLELSYFRLQKRVALVIGNSNYERKALNLPNPARDAKLIAEKLGKAGFDVQLQLDVSIRQTQRAVRQFGNMLRTADVGLFYYAGHAIQVNGRNYMVPTDSQIKSVRDVRYELVDMDLVVDEFSYQTEKFMGFVVLDACRNNPFKADLVASAKVRGQRLGTRGGLAKMSAPPNTLIAFATEPDQVAYDGGGDNSPYTQALVKYMLEPSLEIQKLLVKVRKDVMRTTQNRQVPWEEGSLLGDFYFVRH